MPYNPSLLLALLLSVSTLATILFVAWYFNKEVPGLQEWFFAFLLGSIGLAFFFSQPKFPPLIAILVNQLSLIGVAFLTLRACYQHIGDTFKHTKFVLAVIAIELLVATYLTEIEPNQPLRYFIGGLISGILFSTAGVKFINDGKYKTLPFQHILGYSLLFHGLFNCSRIILFQSSIAEGLKLLSLNPYDVVIYEQLLISILFALGIVMVLNESISKQLRIHAQYDSLTNLFNRRVFLDLLSKNKSLSARTKTPMSLLMIDIDNFKSINDQYGHHIGDQILIDFANKAKNNLRAEDIIARMGGEEFAILLPNTNKESALKFAERLRVKFESSPAKISSNEIFYTISIGVITPHDLMTVDEALNVSDLAMYQAKRSGRNLVKYFSHS